MLYFLDADNRPLDPARDSLGISRHITHDRALPRASDANARSDGDRENFRLEWVDASERRDVVHARLEALDTQGQRSAQTRHVPL
ncbi:MAG: hypothetical protein JWN48_5185 [Myxococcaceae bacterium]|nr:hypothetical protein [Myxococcaceae bacterium]